METPPSPEAPASELVIDMAPDADGQYHVAATTTQAKLQEAQRQALVATEAAPDPNAAHPNPNVVEVLGGIPINTQRFVQVAREAAIARRRASAAAPPAPRAEGMDLLTSALRDLGQGPPDKPLRYK
jgi:hypothetical protein